MGGSFIFDMISLSADSTGFLQCVKSANALILLVGSVKCALLNHLFKAEYCLSNVLNNSRQSLI